MENRTTPPSTPSLARRYICKLLANVASVPVYLAMEAILPPCNISVPGLVFCFRLGEPAG